MTKTKAVFLFRLLLYCSIEILFQSTLCSSHKMAETTTAAAAAAAANNKVIELKGPILVIGAGWCGERLCISSPDVFVATSRSQIKVDQLKERGVVNAIHLDLKDESTWSNVPTNLTGAVLTFALATEDLFALQKFWEVHLANIHVICYSTTSVYGMEVRTDNTPTCGSVVDEKSPLTGVGVSGKSLSDRIEAEEFALQKGACILHLSGICGDVEDGRSPAFMMKHMTNSLRNINYIHITDIIQITSLFVSDGRGSGHRVCVSSGAYTVGDICAVLGLEGEDVPPANPPPSKDLLPNKLIANDFLRSMLPKGYTFTPPLPGLLPIQSTL